MLEINDYIMYKKSVCIVKKIKIIHGKEYYLLQPLDDKSLSINIPVDKIKELVRPIITKKEVNIIIDSIPSIDVIENINDKMVEQEYKTLLNEGSFENLIKIIKTTYLRNKLRKDSKKKISEKDDVYLKKAEKFLYNEFSIALGLSYEDTKKYVIDKVEKVLEGNE